MSYGVELTPPADEALSALPPLVASGVQYASSMAVRRGKPRKRKRLTPGQTMEKAGPTRAQLRRLARDNRPPQSWFEQTNNPFIPERR